jgi:hypothetical protein
MTVSFMDDYCVGVIRNDEFRGFSQQTIHALLKESDFPTEAVDLLKAEALEYVMLEDEDGVAVPVVTSLFYGNAESLTVISNDGEALKGNMEALAPHIAPVEQQIGYWKDYYEMTDEHTALLTDLYRAKSENFHSTIRLTDAQKKMLPGEEIDGEIRTATLAAAERAERMGAHVRRVSLPHLQEALAAYYILSSAEASSNLGRFDGIRFGHRGL